MPANKSWAIISANCLSQIVADADNIDGVYAEQSGISSGGRHVRHTAVSCKVCCRMLSSFKVECVLRMERMLLDF